MSCDWRGSFELLLTAKLFETQTATTTNDRNVEPNSQSSRTGRNRWKAKHAKSMPATSATERVAMTRLWNSAKYAAVRKETPPLQRLEKHPRRTRRRRAGADPSLLGTALWTQTSSRIPGSTGETECAGTCTATRHSRRA